MSITPAGNNNKPGAAGRAGPDTVVDNVDLATGNTVLPIGKSGEIRVKSPHMMTGYYGYTEKTAIASQKGFVYTGTLVSWKGTAFSHSLTVRRM